MGTIASTRRGSGQSSELETAEFPAFQHRLHLQYSLSISYVLKALPSCWYALHTDEGRGSHI